MRDNPNPHRKDIIKRVVKSPGLNKLNSNFIDGCIRLYDDKKSMIDLYDEIWLDSTDFLDFVYFLVEVKKNREQLV